MLSLLWCNLDPAWDFARMVQNHCLDLAADAAVRTWDIEHPGATAATPWPEWPRAVPRNALRDDLDEVLPTHGRRLPLLVAVHLPRGPEAHLSDALELLVWLDQRLQPIDNADLLVTLPAGADAELVGTSAPNARLIARLPVDPAARPLEAIHAQRLLIDLLSDPDARDALRDPGAERLVDCGIRPHQQQAVMDRFSVVWSTLVPTLVADTELLQRGHRPSAGGTDPDEILQSAYAAIEPLSDPPQTLPGLADEATLRPLRPRAPLFFDAGLDRGLRGARDGLLARLNDELEQRYNGLNDELAELKQFEETNAAKLAQEVGEVAPALVGYGSDGERLLRQNLAITEGRSTEIRAEAQRQVQRMEQGLRVRRHLRCGGFDRHRFVEDDDFDAAVEVARQRAEGLMRRRDLLVALLSTAAVTAVPVLSARLPTWRHSGIGGYLADPATWALDLGWLLVPVLLMMLTGFFFARTRRRRLAMALAHAEHCAIRLWQRHMDVLEQTFRLAWLGLAMRRLNLIRQQLLQLQGDLATSRATLRTLRRTLAGQASYYAELAHEHPELGARRQAGGPRGLADYLARGKAADAWIRELLADLPVRQAPEDVAVTGLNLLEHRFPTTSLSGCHALELTAIRR